MTQQATEIVRRSARLSKCGQYRWSLRRTRRTGNGKSICFVMLNPSTADGNQDDPTIRRCIRFAWDWGYSTLIVRNLFPIRATDPKQLLLLPNPKGGRSGNLALAAARSADEIVVAWGASVPFDRVREAKKLLGSHGLKCLGTTKLGQPRHPLYMPAACEPGPFKFDG